MGDRRLGIVLSSCLIVAASCLGGCYFHFDADEKRLGVPPMLIPADAWPAVDSMALDEAAFASEDAPEFDGSSLAMFKDVLGPKAMMGARHSRGLKIRTASALVRVRVTPQGLPSDQWYGFEGLFSAVKPNAYILTSAGFGTGYELYQALTSGTTPWTRGGCLPEVVHERARFTSGLSVRLPTKMPERPRGVLIHLAALFGNEYEAEVMNELLGRGWVVIDVDTATSVIPAMDEGEVERALGLKRASEELGKKIPGLLEAKSYEEWAKIMATNPAARERRLIDMNLAEIVRPAFEVRSETDIEPAARKLARQVDATVGENALVAEAALEVLGQFYPQTRTMPVAVIGFSAGPLSTPTVSARIRGRLSAAVIIGGAANVVTTALNSTLTSGGIRVLCDGQKPTEEQIDAIGAAYLKYSRLDPYHTAPALMGVPVLQVHATWDRWVPAEGGRLLSERLGHPEMLEMPGGHGMLFYFLPWKKGWIADWLDRNVPRVGTSPEPVRSGVTSGIVMRPAR